MIPESLVRSGTASAPTSHAASEFVIYCASGDVRKELLAQRSSTLKGYSDDVRLRLHSSTDDAATLPDVRFDVPAVQAGLRTRAVGRVIVYADETPSTQDMLRTTFRGLPDGAVALASRQTSGRGRRGAHWETPSGSLAFSLRVTLPMSAPERLTFMQYVAALTVVECIQDSPLWSCIPIRVKWPNDLYVDGKKVGGVLCEASTQGRGFDVIVGVGVNISNELPSACLNQALADYGARIGDKFVARISMPVFLSAFLNKFESLYDEFSSSDGFSSMVERYIRAWLHSDQIVTLEKNQSRRARVCGLAPNGYIRVRCLDNDQLMDIAPDVSSLDLVGGIIREKAVRALRTMS